MDKKLLQQLSNFKITFVLAGLSLIFFGISIFFAGFLNRKNGRKEILINIIVAFILFLIVITIINFSL